MSRIFAELVKKRGVGEDFLHPDYEALADPYELPDMEAAVERLARAVERREKVLIYGDYDVDGVTASTLMCDTLRLIGLDEVEVMLPDRFRDGYGMSERVIERAESGGFPLVVTVDCGSRNQEIIAKLGELGVDVVVTDHHECSAKLPEAVAVVNPKRRDCAELSGGLRDLAGVGVAFELARALMLAGMIPEGQEKWLLDLVLIGTLCDAMRITRENRILTYYGVKVLAKTRRRGLSELMRVAKVGKINAETIGFRIGPRLNAAGRIDSAEKALKLLMTQDATEAAKLAEELEGLNSRRRALQLAATDEIRTRGVGDKAVLVVAGQWPEGVLGIIAGKLVEEYKRPAFVLSLVDGVWKGSGRSFGEFNLAEALTACAHYIIGGGGHAEACGVRIEAEKLDDFELAVNEYYRELKLGEQEAYLRQRPDVTVQGLRDLDCELLAELAELEPYGEGNDEPLFLLEKMMVTETRKMGAEQKHLSLTLRGRDGGQMRVVAWNAPVEWMRIAVGTEVNALVRVMENEFRGLKSVEGELLELTGVEDY